MKRPVIVAVSALVASIATVPVVRAATVGQTPQFTTPGSWGPVDFGDQVFYRLSGSGCAGEQVAVHVGGGSRAEAVGPTSLAAADPLDLGSCIGRAAVPSEAAVRSTGWDQGDPISVALEAPSSQVPLRYEREDLAQGTPVPCQVTVQSDNSAGLPVPCTPPANVSPAPPDPFGGAREQTVALSTGDVVDLGPTDLTKVDSISLRVCVPQAKPHLTPSNVELRAGAPNAPSIIGTVDVSDDVNNSNKADLGFPNCWQTQPWPILNAVPGRDPELYLAADQTAQPVDITWIDFNGTGAKDPQASGDADPAGTQSIFDGKDFTGWTASNCAIDDDGSVRNVHTSNPTNYTPLATEGFVGEQGCGMTYTARKLHNVMIMFDYRQRSFEDNGAVYVLGHEIQTREAAEWMTGGVLGNEIPQALATQWATNWPASGYPAQRIKTNSYPDWSEMVIVQIGPRIVVRINGRTVTDCSNCLTDTGPYNFEVLNQPNFSYDYAVGFRMDTGPTEPNMTDPSSWGNFSYRNFRVYDCQSLTDPVCVGVPSIDGMPHPSGMPASEQGGPVGGGVGGTGLGG